MGAVGSAGAFLSAGVGVCPQAPWGWPPQLAGTQRHQHQGGLVGVPSEKKGDENWPRDRVWPPGPNSGGPRGVGFGMGPSSCTAAVEGKSPAGAGAGPRRRGRESLQV